MFFFSFWFLEDLVHIGFYYHFVSGFDFVPSFLKNFFFLKSAIEMKIFYSILKWPADGVNSFRFGTLMRVFKFLKEDFTKE